MAEPALARAGEGGGFGIAKHFGDVRQWDAALGQIVLRHFAAHVVADVFETGVFGLESALQGALVQARVERTGAPLVDTADELADMLAGMKG